MELDHRQGVTKPHAPKRSAVVFGPQLRERVWMPQAAEVRRKREQASSRRLSNRLLEGRPTLQWRRSYCPTSDLAKTTVPHPYQVFQLFFGSTSTPGGCLDGRCHHN